MNFLITAIVCDDAQDNPAFGGDYFKVVASSNIDDIKEHQIRLEANGWRVLSVKAQPSELDPLDEDMQGNMSVVDDRKVIP